MVNKPFFWLGVGTMHGISSILFAWNKDPIEMVLVSAAFMWFSWAIAGLLAKLNQLGERIENSQRLQTTAFRTLRK